MSTIDEIKSILAQSTARANAATKAPWHVANNGYPPGDERNPAFPSVRDDSGRPHGEDIISTQFGFSEDVQADSAFIAHSRTDLPARDAALLVAVEALASYTCSYPECRTGICGDVINSIDQIAAILKGESK